VRVEAMVRVLVVSSREELGRQLGELGYGVEVVEPGTVRKDEGWDLLVVDLVERLEEALRGYRRMLGAFEGRGPGVLLVVAGEDLAKLPLGLEFSELLVAPWRQAELAFRIRRLLWHKKQREGEAAIVIGDLAIFPARYEVRVKGKPVALTLKEYELLKYLVTHRGRAFRREVLLSLIWGYEYYGGTRTVDVHIRRIRAKIGDADERYIKTVRGVGYMFR